MSEIIKVPMRIVQSMQQYQSRADTSLDPKAVEEYAERYRQGLPMDPIQVCGQRHLSLYIVDGHHRFEGMKMAYGDMQTEIDVEVVDSRIDPAVVRWNAAGSNTKHGKPRTPADKRKAVDMVLKDFPTQSDDTIAAHCDVSRMFVFKRRDELGIAHPQNEQIEAKQAALTQQVNSIPPPPQTPPPEPGKEEQGRNDVVNVYNDVSSPEATPEATPPPPPPPSAPPSEMPRPPLPRPPIPPPPSSWNKTPPGQQASQSRFKDEMFRPIPPALQAFYARRVEVMAVSKNLREILATLRKGVQEHDPLWAKVDGATLTSLESVLKAVDDCRPMYVCPSCTGMSLSCQLCSHRGGFIGREEYENLVKNDPELMQYMQRAAIKYEGEEKREASSQAMPEAPAETP